MNTISIYHGLRHEVLKRQDDDVLEASEAQGHNESMKGWFLKFSLSLSGKSCMTKVGAALSLPGTLVAQLRRGTRDMQSPPESLRTLFA